MRRVVKSKQRIDPVRLEEPPQQAGDRAGRKEAQERRAEEEHDRQDERLEKNERRAASGEILGSGTWGAQFLDEIKPQPGDVVLPRYTSLDPSVGSGLWEAVEGRETLCVAGISTTIAVEGT